MYLSLNFVMKKIEVEEYQQQCREFKKQIKLEKSPCKWWEIIVKQKKKKAGSPLKRLKINEITNINIFIQYHGFIELYSRLSPWDMKISCGVLYFRESLLMKRQNLKSSFYFLLCAPFFLFGWVFGLLDFWCLFLFFYFIIFDLFRVGVFDYIIM